MTAWAGPARAAAEAAARAGYSRLVAFLSSEGRDIAAAEDALADALQAALETWPERGVPDSPTAWLLTTARRRMVDVGRHDRVRADAAAVLRLIADERSTADADDLPDRRLALLFACAHPAIDAAARAPLMLQAIFGLDAARIAAAFLTTPAAMGQRLVRAKAKIRDAGIGFAIPARDALQPRLDAVLDAIYAAYGSGWDDVAEADPKRRGLAHEALWLAQLTAALLAHEPEPAGLVSLLLHCEARRGARRDAAGAYVPLSAQDRALWCGPMIAAAEAMLRRAAQAGRPGRFQLEAAIQSAHVARLTTGAPPWSEIVLLYDGLIALAPTAGALVARAAAAAEAIGPQAALDQLSATPDLDGYQPYWALRAHLSRQLGLGDAQAAAARAAELSDDPAVRLFLTDAGGSAWADDFKGRTAVPTR